MSIAGMADARLQRQRDREQRLKVKPTRDPDSSITPMKGLSDLARYIPAEALALYTAVLSGAFDPLTPRPGEQPSDLDYSSRWWFFLGACAATAVLVYLIYKAKTSASGYEKGRADLPVFEMSLAVVALAAWASALPDTPFADFAWYGDWWPPFIIPFSIAVIPLIAAAARRSPPTYEVDVGGGGGRTT
jgi:hypothetical protein